jgi:DHA2 family multidrug resistance protein
MGVGISGFFMPMTAIAMSSLKPQQFAAGSGLTNFLRNMGGSIGTAIATTVWQDNAARHHAHLVENIALANPAYQQFSDQAASVGLVEPLKSAVIEQLISSQAYLLSTNQLMIAAGVLLLCLLPLIWLAKPPFGAAKGAH